MIGTWDMMAARMGRRSTVEIYCCCKHGMETERKYLSSAAMGSPLSNSSHALREWGFDAVRGGTKYAVTGFGIAHPIAPRHFGKVATSPTERISYN